MLRGLTHINPFFVMRYDFKPYTSLIERCDLEDRTIFKRRKSDGSVQIVESFKTPSKELKLRQ